MLAAEGARSTFLCESNEWIMKLKYNKSLKREIFTNPSKSKQWPTKQNKQHCLTAASLSKECCICSSVTGQARELALCRCVETCQERKRNMKILVQSKF